MTGLALATLLLFVGFAQAEEQYRTFTVDGMVGQVNGQAIYAEDVLEPIGPQLDQLYGQLSRRDFMRQAAQLASASLRQIVTDALILGEAQRDLNEGERQALRMMIQRERERILREYGRGALAVAEQRLMEERGVTLDQFLDQRREEIIVQRYLSTRLLPQVNVSRKDIERYYRENYDQFNPPAERDLRILMVDSPEKAQSMLETLAEDSKTDFENHQGVRQMSMNATMGEDVFADVRVNEILGELSEGEAGGPIEVGEQHWIVVIDRLDQSDRVSLKEAQLRIEDLLRKQQFQIRVDRYKDELFEKGSYNPMEEMTESMMYIILGRYGLDTR